MKDDVNYELRITNYNFVPLPTFYPKLLIKVLARLVDGKLDGVGNVEITRVASIESATNGEIAFIEKDFQPTNAACVIIPENFSEQFSCPTIQVRNPKLAFAKIAEKLHPIKFQNSWNESAVISKTAEVLATFIGAFVSIGENSNIGEAAQIYDGVRIGANVSIGKCTVIYPNCVIYDNVTIGNDCVLHAGAIIGADGFGYVPDGINGYVKFPQIGTVILEDNVEIGANSCIDRGALGETRIGEGTKIDNLVQIAHNVQIGKRVVIAAQTGISGSTVIEDDCVIGGQVGMGDHARVQSGAVIGSQAGVLPGKIVRPGIWWGTPVQPLDEYKRQNAMVKGLGRLRDEIKELKKRIKE